MSNSECIICYESINSINKITFANCIHGSCVHAVCILGWNHTCPMCRSNIYDNDHTIYDIQNNIDYYDKSSP